MVLYHNLPYHYFTKKGIRFSRIPLLLVIGLEPIRGCPRGILSPLRLPIPPHQQILCGAKRLFSAYQYTLLYLVGIMRRFSEPCAQSVRPKDEWMEVDSNHRSNLQQIYSLSPLATRESIHII